MKETREQDKNQYCVPPVCRQQLKENRDKDNVVSEGI